MIKAVTSIADLIYKSKTQDPYKSLLILAVKGLLANKNVVIESYEQALEQLTGFTEGHSDCSDITETINWYRHQITDPANEEFNRLFILKQRQLGKTQTTMRFDGNNMMFAEAGGGYSQLSQEYGRIRREVMSGNSTYSIASQQRPAPTTDVTSFDDGGGYEVIERHYINPVTGIRHTVRRRIPSNIPANIRREVEEELRLDAESEIRSQITSSRRRNVSQFGDPDDFYSSYWDDDIH